MIQDDFRVYLRFHYKDHHPYYRGRQMIIDFENDANINLAKKEYRSLSCISGAFVCKHKKELARYSAHLWKFIS